MYINLLIKLWQLIYVRIYIYLDISYDSYKYNMALRLMSDEMYPKAEEGLVTVN